MSAGGVGRYQNSQNPGFAVLYGFTAVLPYLGKNIRNPSLGDASSKLPPMLLAAPLLAAAAAAAATAAATAAPMRGWMTWERYTCETVQGAGHAFLVIA